MEEEEDQGICCFTVEVVMRIPARNSDDARSRVKQYLEFVGVDDYEIKCVDDSYP